MCGASGVLRSKMMPPSVAMRTYEAHQAFYDKLQDEVARASGSARIEPDDALAALTVSTRLTSIGKRFSARAILISGCQDNQSSYDGAHNGALIWYRLPRQARFMRSSSKWLPAMSDGSSLFATISPWGFLPNGMCLNMLPMTNSIRSAPRLTRS
jgi:hypothetical protein